MLQEMLRFGPRVLRFAVRSRALRLRPGGSLRYLHGTGKKAADLVTCEVDSHGVALITLNDPPRLNALTAEMGDCLTDIVSDLRSDDHLKAAVLTVRWYSYGRSCSELNCYCASLLTDDRIR